MLILNDHLMEIADVTLTPVPGLSAVLSAADGLTATMGMTEPGTDLTDSDGNALKIKDGDVLITSESGIRKFSATLTELILARGVV